MVFPGSKIDTNWYQSALVKEGKGLLPLGFSQLTGDAKEGAPSVSIISQRFENPALELFNDPRNGSLADAAIRLNVSELRLGRAAYSQECGTADALLTAAALTAEPVIVH